mgnify:CR=1 FL=1
MRVEFAGQEFSPDNELNGIAFQGVGNGTTVEYVQVHYNQDDGTEPFGGSTTQTHVVTTGIGDDSFDYSFEAKLDPGLFPSMRIRESGSFDIAGSPR